MSYFPPDRIARMAARDFLQDPKLMPIAYFEWAHATQRLANSGQLSAGAKEMVLELAEVRALCTISAVHYQLCAPSALCTISAVHHQRCHQRSHHSAAIGAAISAAISS